MICVSLADLDFEHCRRALESTDCAEIRLDRCRFTREEITRLFSLESTLIATCRPGSYTENERRVQLAAAITAGASYVDIEVEAEKGFREELTELALKHTCGLILSYHNYEETPSRQDLIQILEECFLFGADIAKIVCLVRSLSDSARILSLYDNVKKFEESGKKLIALGMGEEAQITRFAAPLLGAPFTYAAPGPGRETAPGQLTKDKLSDLLKLLKNG
jgi:3-dehydroquinate dehydratase-1